MMSAASMRRIKEVAGLDRRRNRKALGCFLVEGMRSLEASLDADAHLVDVFVSEGESVSSTILDRLEQRNVPVYEVSDRDMQKMSDVTTPAGVLAVAHFPEGLHDAPTTMPRMLYLDGLQDPGNVGTLIRTAAWLGVDAVIAAPGTADFFSPKVVRSSMGGIWDVALHQLESTKANSEWLDALQDQGVGIWTADMNGGVYTDWQPGRPSVLTIGSEAHGISEAVSTRASGSVQIPSRSGPRGVESLNASVAGAILMSHW